MKLTSLLTLLVFVQTATAAPPQWPQFRGPNGAGIAEDAHPPIHFGPTTNLLWKTAPPPGHSSPCVWDTRIFLTGFEPERKKLETLCLDRHTGRIL